MEILSLWNILPGTLPEASRVSIYFWSVCLEENNPSIPLFLPMLACVSQFLLVCLRLPLSSNLLFDVRVDCGVEAFAANIEKSRVLSILNEQSNQILLVDGGEMAIFFLMSALILG